MIATISADNYFAEANAVKSNERDNERAPGSLFSLFMQNEPEVEKHVTEGKQEKDPRGRNLSEDKTQKDEQPQCGLENALQHIMENLQRCGAAENESNTQAIKTITDILEGNIIPSDKDIASLTEPILISFNELTDGEKEAIMARMPQITGALQDTSGSVAGETDMNRFYLCPLENFSEQPQENVSDSSETVMTTLQESTLKDSSGPAGMSSDVPDRGAQDSLAQEESKDSDILPEAVKAANTVEASENSGLDAGIASASFQNSAAEDTLTERCAATDVLARMEETFLSYDMQSDRELEIQLEPENLGKLSVYLSMGEDGVKARISTGDSRVQSVLASGLTELINKLSENGISVKSVDVICAEMNWQQPGDRDTGGGNGQKAFTGKGRGGACVNAALGGTAGTDICSWEDSEALESTVLYYA